MANNIEKSIFKLLNKYALLNQSNLEKINFNKIFKEFIDNGGNINEKKSNGLTVLMLESQTLGSYLIIEALLKNGANPNIQANDGKTALIYAAIHGKPVIIEELIERGAQINIKDNYGMTALMYACQIKYPPYGKYKDAVFNLIHDPDLKIDARDNLGITALYHCVKSKADSNIKELLLEQLLEKDSDPSIDDIDHDDIIVI